MLHPKPARARFGVRGPRATPARFWGAIALVWAVLLVAFAFAIAPSFATGSPVEVAALGVFAVASGILWLGGIRYLAMWVSGGMWRGAVRLARDDRALASARVALIACAADDFNADALRRSIAQQRDVTVVILDDSKSEAGKRAVDLFAAETGAEVLRRSDRRGFKAGNLNTGIERIASRFDYVVLLDSDDVLPPDFVERALGHFARDPKVGIVQARHVAWRGDSAFTAQFAGLLGTHIDVTQRARSAGGFSMFMGRGAMISLEAYRAAGGIPELVMEDVAFSLEVHRAGYRVAYAPEIVCTEDYPVDYAAFRSQHRKLVEGTTEFVRRSWRRILGSRMRWYEKIDLLFEQLMIPFGAVVGLSLLTAGVVLFAAGDDVRAPLWVAGMTSLSIAAPLLPEAARLLRAEGFGSAARYLVLAAALYGSVLVLTVRAAAKVMLGRKATFRVTPKTRGVGGRFSAVRMLRAELIVAVLAAGFGLFVLGSVVPVLALIGPTLAALYLDSLASRPAPVELIAGRGVPGTTVRHADTVGV
ncbi:glycosyltransferase family 2 protein [Lysobacter korlensis]|uniref:Glycosyltransferase family 2 protein n=1 Tax=Lysobacter korlensis TaxID=553636 RepID=A0ABV6RYK5_9GAMM